MKLTKHWKHGYKAVSLLEGEYRSLLSWLPPSASVRYTLGTLTRPNPNCGPLAVFQTLEQAQEFLTLIRIPKDRAILAVRYLPSRRRTLWFPLYGTRAPRPLTGTPYGTVLADVVLPLYKVETLS